jgi:YfiH family protein
VIRFEEFEGPGLAVAAFTEASDGNFSLRGEDATDGIEARRRFAEACGADPRSLALAQQVHGVEVLRVGAAERGRGALSREDALGPADALVTDVPGLPLAVLVADCVPVYLYDPVKNVIGIAHAGWRGTFDRIAAHTVERMRGEWGCEPGDLRALIGPSAGPCCYEVSEELAEQFRAAGLVARERMVDLWASNARVLVEAGVAADNIRTAGLCTLCSNRFHSHRRSATHARNMALISLP